MMADPFKTMVIVYPNGTEVVLTGVRDYAWDENNGSICFDTEEGMVWVMTDKILYIRGNN